MEETQRRKVAGGKRNIAVLNATHALFEVNLSFGPRDVPPDDTIISDKMPSHAPINLLDPTLVAGDRYDCTPTHEPDT